MHPSFIFNAPLRSLRAFFRLIFRLSYGLVRPFVRREVHVNYNGIPLPDRIKITDRYVRGFKMDRPNYESALMSSIRKYVRSGQTVVVIGGGIGVTSVAAAKIVGSNGRVVAFEGNLENVDRIMGLARFNGVDGIIEVVPGIVGSDIGVYDGKKAALTVRAEEIPFCDVLELDCEGAEKEILPRLKIRPEYIIVETHGFLGATTSDVLRALDGLGYDVENLGVAEVDHRGSCLDNDIMVLVGQLRDSIRLTSA